MKKFYLYKILNIVTEKVYIGLTATPDQRFKQHMSPGSTCTKLRNSVAKHGKDNFRMDILCIGSEEYILDLEVKTIILYDSIKSGYNLVLGNPRTGGASLSEEVKDSIAAGLALHYSENRAWNFGIPTEYRSDDVPVCVTGFWFPNRRTALAATGLNQKTYYSWAQEGTLDKVQHLSKDSVTNVPQYVGGFWFNNLITASEKLNVSIVALKKRLREGFVEVVSSKPESKKAENNPMFGRTGIDHPRARAIKIFDIIYASISDAVRQTNFTKSMIEKRLKNKIEGFEYVNPSPA